MMMMTMMMAMMKIMIVKLQLGCMTAGPLFRQPASTQEPLCSSTALQRVKSKLQEAITALHWTAAGFSYSILLCSGSKVSCTLHYFELKEVIHNCAALYYRRFHLQCIAPQEVKTKLHHFELHKVITTVCNVLQEVKTELHFMYWNRSKLHCDVHYTALLARCQNYSSILSERSKQFFSPTIRQAHEKQHCSAGNQYCTDDELQGT